MTDFEATLRVRLERLDAAIPDPGHPVIVAVRRRPNRRRQMIILLAAAVAFLGVAALGTVATPPPPDPAVVAKNAADEERVLSDLGPYFESVCLTRDQATVLIRNRLDALGLSSWTIRIDDRIKEAQCVGGAPSGDTHEVILLASMGGEVGKALDRLGADLLQRCVGRADAVRLLQAALESAGAIAPKIEIGGIRQVPLINGDAYVQHVRDGCYVYGGAQFDDVGRYTWYLSGE
jgi:hypothetical protein